jgi:4'-phosphopantetheinyl transferase
MGAQAFDEGFLFCWTRKEALIKAIGKGLSFPLKVFSTIPEYRLLTPVGSAKADAEPDSNDWKIISFLPAEGYFGALATANSAANIEFFDY